MAEYEYGNHPTKRKKNGKRQSCLKHRVVWMEHHGEIPKGYMIHHINGDKKDNRIENLIMLTNKEHGIIHGKVRSSHNKMSYPAHRISIKSYPAHRISIKADSLKNLINDLTRRWRKC